MGSRSRRWRSRFRLVRASSTPQTTMRSVCPSRSTADSPSRASRSTARLRSSSPQAASPCRRVVFTPPATARSSASPSTSTMPSPTPRAQATPRSRSPSAAPSVRPRSRRRPTERRQPPSPSSTRCSPVTLPAVTSRSGPTPSHSAAPPSVTPPLTTPPSPPRPPPRPTSSSTVSLQPSTSTAARARPTRLVMRLISSPRSVVRSQSLVRRQSL